MRLATWGKPDFELATFLNISVLNPHTDTRNSLLTRVHAFLVAGADEDDRCIGFLPPGRGGTKPPSSLALHEAAGSGNTSLVRVSSPVQAALAAGWAGSRPAGALERGAHSSIFRADEGSAAAGSTVKLCDIYSPTDRPGL